MEKSFTLTIFTENKSGLLNRLAIILTRRKINIDSLTTSPSEIEGVYRFTILIKTTADEAQKVVKQMEKQIEVIKAFYYEADEVVYQEIALYKVAINLMTSGNILEKIVRDNHARILTIEKEFIVIEKTGHDSEIQALFEVLEPFGVYEFVRSGRVAVAKQMNNLGEFLKTLEKVGA
jgi:acetolactate synthase I/III small subunit